MTTPFNINTIYTSCACNRTPQSADWGYNDLVCFGTSHAIAICSPKNGNVVQTSCSHKDRVNCVRWIRKPDSSSETEFISCSCDKTAVVWKKIENGRFEPLTVLEGHADSVSVTDGMYIGRNTNELKDPKLSSNLLVVTGSVDSSVKVWLREGGESRFSCFQTINCGTGFSLCLRLAYLPQTSEIVLLSATDDSKVHLYVSDLKAVFTKVHSLVGHEDWIHAMDVTSDLSGNLLIATGSQDTMIRLWQLSPKLCVTTNLSPLDADIQPEEKTFKAGGKEFTVTMESVLAGHDGWIYSICWYANGETTRMKLLSASLDKSIIVWSPDPQTGMWLENVRVGDMGGNTLGFYGGMFSPNGLSILGHGYQGSFHLWTCCADTTMWEPKATIGGHFGEVVDIQWEPGGRYLLSVSKDQTTRLHAPWLHEDNKVSWFEISRPQIHGFDMSCIAIFSQNKFVSGAEEKVIRAFHAPNDFIQNFQRLCKIKLYDEENVNAPRGASVPALGLSNKAVYEIEILPEDRHVKDEFPAAYFVPLELNEPPTEEHLMQNTLWPEIQKLYGHGYEIYTLAAHPNGSLVASACKATSAEHAAIILWDTSNWQQEETLVSHQLTVTQMAFSPDGKYLLSVSRDRSWSLFQKTDNSFKLVSKTSNKTGVHARIIWTCAWSADSKYFATGSRDGKLCIWKAGSGEPKNLAVLELKGSSITAVAFQIESTNDRYLLALGLESGEIMLYYWYPSSTEWKKVHHLDRNKAHHLTVKRLAFRPQDKTHLASCGADGSVKIHLLSAV